MCPQRFKRRCWTADGHYVVGFAGHVAATRERSPIRLAAAVVAAAVAGIGIALLCVSSASAASIGAVGSTQLVRPVERPATTSSISFVAARNEFESAQVVVQADAAALTGVRASIVGTLTRMGTGGAATIPASAMTLYRVGYADLKGLPSNGEMGGQLGRYPDALIPVRDEIWGEARTAFPVRIAANENQLVWLDVLVPEAQQAGTYRGASVRITADGGLQHDVPIQLEVMDVTLPSTTSLDGGFDMNPNQVCRAHACGAYPGGSGALLAAYARVALDNRLSIAKPPTGPSGTGYATYTKPLVDGTAPTRLRGARLRTITIYQWADASDAAAWWRTSSAGGFAQRVRYHCDEVGKSSAMWSACRTKWTAANGAWRGAGAPFDLPLEVTTSIDDVEWARRAGFGDVVERIAVLIPVINYVHPKNGSAFPGDRDRFSSWNGGTTAGGAPRSLWSYTSCMSMGCSPADADLHPFWSGWPSYGVDQPASEARAMGWISYLYDLKGEYYYETARDLPTAWTNLWSNDGGNHGDGTLFYPGTVAAIGGAHDTPLESIRLKRIRDGREDHELLLLAEQAVSRATVLARARQVMTSAHETNVSQASIDAGRVTLFGWAAGQAPVTTWPEPAPAPDPSPEPSPSPSPAPSPAAPTPGTPTPSPSVNPASPAPARPRPAAPANPSRGTGTPTAPVPARETRGATTAAPYNGLVNGRPAPPPSRQPRVMCGGVRATIVGTNRSDVIIGTPGRDVIAALGGNDRIIGLGGGDVICTGRGFDRVTVAGGSHRVSDLVICGAGRDVVTLGPRDRARGRCEQLRRPTLARSSRSTRTS